MPLLAPPPVVAVAVAVALALGLVGVLDGLTEEEDGDAEELADGLAVACGSTKIWTRLPEGLLLCPAGFWLQTVPGVTG